MSKKLYEESNILEIANAIRDKNGTQHQYTTAQMPDAIRAIQTPPDLEELTASGNGDYAPSSGKDGFSIVHVRVSSSFTIQPLNVSENGIYNPPSGIDGYGPVTVNVSGGSVPPGLPNSDQSKILASAYPANYSDDNLNWGGLEVIKSSSTGIIKISDFIYLRNNSFAEIDLGEPNHSFVAYFVGLVFDGGQWPVIIGNWYDNSTNNSIALCTNGKKIAYTHYGNTIAVTSFDVLKLLVGTIRVDGTNKLSSCFINGEQIAQSTSFNNSGRYCSFGAFSNRSYSSNLFIKYLAVVDGVENDSTIISNQQHLMNLYGIE